MLKKTKKKVLATLMCVALVSMAMIVPAMAVEPLVVVTAGANAGSGQTGMCDWSAAWGVPSGTGMELELVFSAPFTDAAAYTRFPDTLAQYITVNGVDLATRHANDPSLGIADVDPGLWDGNNMVLTNYSDTSLHIIMVGGGTGNLVITEVNTVVLSADFPLLSGTLGREITLTFDPATLAWTSPDSPTAEPTEPAGTILPEDAVTVTAGANDGSGQVGMCDWSSAWGIPAGTGMELELIFSEPFTDKAAYSFFSDTLAQYITVNGVNLASRVANKDALGVAAIDPGLWGGNCMVLMNYSDVSLHIIMVGGGTGNLDITKENTIILDDDLPMLNGRPMGRTITLTFDPETMEWSETVGEQITVAAGANDGSGQTGMCDWSAAWGVPAGTGMELELIFSKPFTDQGAYTGFSDTLAKYITVNGVNLATRAANDPSLGIAAIDPGLWGGNPMTLMNYSDVSLHIILVGGGTGNLDITKENTIIIDDDFPLLNGRPLGRTITLSFDPETLVWSEVLGEKITVAAGANDGSGQTGMCDWSSAWGIPAGTGMELELIFSKPFTAAAAYTGFSDTLAKYITVNGVNLATRAANDPSLGIAAIDPGLWGGNPMTLMNYSDVSLHIILVGGGTGNLDITKENKVVIDDDFPLLNGRPLGRHITMLFDPETLVWTEREEIVGTPTPSPSPTPTREPVSHVISREEAALLTVTAGTPSGCAQKGIWDRSSEWGLEAGKGLEVQLRFSGEYTNASQGANLNAVLGPFITVNGVNLLDRADFDASLGMDDIRLDLYDGNNVMVTNYYDEASTQLAIILLGGGTGNLDKSKANTIVLSADFPLPSGLTLGREITLTYDPASQTWTSSLDTVDTGDTDPAFLIIVAVSMLLAIFVIAQERRKARS